MSPARVVTIAAAILLLSGPSSRATECADAACSCQQLQEGVLLMHCAITGLQPTEWPQHATHLVVSYSNNITTLNELPATGADTVSVSLARCSITTLADQLFTATPGIKYVDLSWNRLTGSQIRKDVFATASTNTLRELHLKYNRIESLQRSAFTYIQQLTTLDLSGNPLRTLDAGTSAAIASLTSLRVLRAANASLTTVTFPPKCNCSLQRVDLSGNHLTDVPYLGYCLTELNLDGNRMKRLDDRSFSGLHQLRTLKINHMERLTSIGHNTFAQLDQLRVLQCENNNRLTFISRTKLERTTIIGCNNSNERIMFRHIESSNDSAAAGKVLLLSIPVVLTCIAVVFFWRVIIKRRDVRLVNSMYPVVYTCAPTNELI